MALIYVFSKLSYQKWKRFAPSDVIIFKFYWMTFFFQEVDLNDCQTMGSFS